MVRYPASSSQWLRRSIALLPIVPVLALALLVGSKSSEAPAWRDLGTVFPGRPLRCRIFGQHQFRPFSGAVFLSGQAGLPERRLLRLSLSVQEDLAKAETPERLADAAVLDLLNEKWDRAISSLDQALILAPGDPRILTDASAAYLERGIRSDRPLDLLEALRHAMAAQERAPESSEALFNMGLALHHLHLRRREAKVWQRYLDLEPRSGWAGEARRWLAEAQDETFRSDQELCRRQILNGEISDSWLRSAVGRYPDKIREVAEEELLGRWARAVQQGHSTEAERWMTRLDRIACQLAEQRDERLLSAGLEALRSAARAGPGDRMDRLVRGYVLFDQGMRSYRGQSFATAEMLLSAAEEALRRAGSPLADSARLYRGICIYYGNAESSRALFSSVLVSPSAALSPSLAGRALWMLGTADLVQGRFEDALQSFVAMRSQLERGGGAGQAAMADLMLAQAYELRGDIERGWKYRLNELNLLTVQGSLRRRHSLLLEAAQALARRGQSEMSLLFLAEVLDNAALWKQPLARAEAYTLRSRVQLKLNHPRAALEDAHRAIVAIAEMQSGPLKARTQGQALMSQGLAHLEREPRQALSILQRAYDLQKASNWEVEKILYLNSMARACLALHQSREARKFLEGAVQTYEAYRSDALEPNTRITIFQYAQETFDSLMLLSWEDPESGPRQAFNDSERSRSRALLDAWSRHPTGEAPKPANANRVLRELPPGVTLVQYAVLPDEILVWAFQDGTMREARHPVPGADLEDLVQRFRRALQRSDTERSRVEGARLYDLLLRDLPIEFDEDGRLVIVPDGPLEQVPFATLLDQKTGSYLIEKTSLSVAPSATLFLAALRKARRPGEHPTLLTVAPDLAGSPYAFLPLLPGAREEVRKIRGLYPQATILDGKDANRAHFLRDLPNHSILHFAGHAVLLDPESGRIFLLVAPAEPGDRGEISIESLRELRLAHTKLVVLAACRSMNGYSPGREGALSIASAFFAAGAPTVVASLWDVDDRHSPDFMIAFHRRVAAGEGAADALRTVMVDFITSGDPEKSSPTTWGVFAVLGA